MTAFKTVMLCEKREWGDLKSNELPAGNYSFEPKLDGIRIKAVKNGNVVKLVGRSGEDYTNAFPEVVDGLKLYQHDFLPDGEMCAASGNFGDISGRVHLRDRFKIALRAKVNPAVYHMFDVLEMDGRDLLKLPLRERKPLLESLGETERVKIVRSTPLEELVRLVNAQRLEGIVAKDLDSPYEFCRSPRWLKFRPAPPHDLPIIGYEDSDKPGRPFRSLIILMGDREIQASSGLSMADLQYAKEIFAQTEVVRTSGRKHYFKEPVGTCEVAFSTLPNLPVRFPKVIAYRMRSDKPVSSVPPASSAKPTLSDEDVKSLYGLG